MKSKYTKIYFYGLGDYKTNKKRNEIINKAIKRINFITAWIPKIKPFRTKIK